MAAPPARRLGLFLWASESTPPGTAAAAAGARRPLRRPRIWKGCAWRAYVDWWEEREGVHAATLACIAAGLGDELDLTRAEGRLDASLLVLPFLGF